jgi:hypothetical protein
VGFPKDGPFKVVSLKVFENLKITHKYKNLHAQINECYFMGTWEHFKIKGSTFP